MDDADRSDQKIENAIADAIREARRGHGMKATGFCLYCSEPVQQHYLFCCGECSQDWTKEQKIRHISGKPYNK